jgi:hypothetical protein
MGKNGDQKRGALAGSGLGFADGVLAFECIGKNTRLHRGAVFELKIVNGVEDLVREMEVMKTDFSFFLGDLELLGRPGGSLGRALFFGFGGAVTDWFRRGRIMGRCRFPFSQFLISGIGRFSVRGSFDAKLDFFCGFTGTLRKWNGCGFSLGEYASYCIY